MSKLPLLLSSLVFGAAIAAIAPLVMHRRGQVEIQENEALLRQRDCQLAALTAENQRLSNLVVQARPTRATADDQTSELAQLRAEAEGLRRQTNEFAKQLAEQRLSAGVQFYVTGDSNLLTHNKELRITIAGGPREENGKLNDARVLAAALRKYADEHQGEFPLNLEQVAPNLPKPLQPDSPPWANGPLSGTNEFEIVFQGTQNDLTNIPLRRVALLRERQPWPASEGKMARAYGYADGAASLVESDDNFQSWDARHLIPSRPGGQ